MNYYLKNTLLTLVVLVVSFGLVLIHTAQAQAGDTSATEVKKEVAEAAATIWDFTIERRDAALVKAKQLMDDMDARIDNMEDRIDEQWDQMSKAARDKAKASLRELRAKRNKVSEWYGGMKSSSAGAWEEIKKGFSDAYKDLSEAVEEAKKEF